MTLTKQELECWESLTCELQGTKFELLYDLLIFVPVWTRLRKTLDDPVSAGLCLACVLMGVAAVAYVFTTVAHTLQTFTTNPYL